MKDDLKKTGMSLEEEYFHRKNREAIQKLKKKGKGEASRERKDSDTGRTGSQNESEANKRSA